ncbi:hypothetical protein [Limibacterium fermenti]|uniref:hypothetical protein n=1 Tax=Limibacterium fermenti TaxID=3229863 RepID=UPI003A75F675
MKKWIGTLTVAIIALCSMNAYVYFTNCRSDVTAIRNDSTRERTQNSVRINYDDYKQLNEKSK